MSQLNSKIPVAVVMGGYSTEWEISVKTGQNVVNDLDTSLFDVYAVYILPTGWYALINGVQIPINRSDFSIELNQKSILFEGVFIAIHGNPGEDGKIQGYFDLLKIPYTSSGVFESALTFNKAECNMLLRQFDIPGAKAIYYTDGDPLNVEEVVAQLGLPLFVKPSRAGSSFGVSMVKHIDEFQNALTYALQEDNRILIEQKLNGTEVSCGVCNWQNKIEAIAVTEIVPQGAFFDFQAKYEGKSEEITPARISAQAYEKVMKLTEIIYEKLHLNGLARCDFFVDSEENVYLVEVNSVPGLSDASIVPQQIRYRGWSTKAVFTALLTNCISNSKLSL